MIHSYREELDFEGFRKALEKNEGYQKGITNKYIFPDERSYINSIYAAISIPLRIEISLERKEGEEWKAISPDEAL